MYPVPDIISPAEIIDSHAHYNDKRFDGIIDGLMKKQKELGVKRIINCGCDFESIDACLRLGEKYDFCYTAVGFHPENLPEGDLDIERLRVLAALDKVCAIGEIGLDYYWEPYDKEKQKQFFISQLKLARKLSMPVVIHDRESHGDVDEIIRSFPDVKILLHSYSGSAEWARELVRAGRYISFSGVVTFKNARKAVEAAKAVPLDRILIETDCP